MTHDSIGLGEDGPTHQPVEHLSALRAIPNLTVIRPCDIIETIESWEVALQNAGPTVLVLTRQNLPLIQNSERKDNYVKKGAYVKEGQVIGKMGSTGRAVGAHLHYEIKINGKSTNPYNFISVGRNLLSSSILKR